VSFSFNWIEGSTKRGLALASGSLLSLVQIAGNSGSVVEILAKPEFWVAMGGLASGLIGMFVSDEKAHESS